MAKNSRGFTLIELIIVVVIIGIVSAMGFLGGTSTYFKKARDGKREAELEQLRSALEMYRSDQEHYFNNTSPYDPTVTYSVLLSKNPPDALQGALVGGGYLGKAIDDPSGGQISCACSGRSGNCGLRYYYRYVGSGNYARRYFILATLETKANEAQVWNCAANPPGTLECFTPGDVPSYGFKHVVCSP